MIKKGFFILMLAIVVFGVKAQNLQLHYDLGKGRNYLTSTVEMFRPDKYGSTFFFIDMNYSAGGIKGVSLGYWEIARAIKFWDEPVALHAEYNGGSGLFNAGESIGGYVVRDAWLGGLEYSFDAENFSKGFTIQALYKYIRGKHDASFQLTGVWYLNFLKNKFSFTGYTDFWREDFIFDGDKTRFVIQSEPQLWFNVNKKFAIGGEAEIDYNFLFKGLKCYPTLGAKVTF